MKHPTKKIKEKLLASTGSFKEYSESDKIIKYLSGKDEKALAPNLKVKFERYSFIHGLRMRYHQHSYIVGILKEKYNRPEKQARVDIAEAEYVFGKAINVSRQYELNFLIQLSIKNIELAMATKDVKSITMALKLHHEILGPEVDASEVFDPAKFEQHVYNMILPDGVNQLLKDMLKTGAINLSKALPKTINIEAND